MSTRSKTPQRLPRFSAIFSVALALLALLGASCERPGTKEDVESRYSNLVSPNNAITQAGDESRTGWFPDQPLLDSATVGGPNFKRLFKTPLPLTPGEQVLAQPL